MHVPLPLNLNRFFGEFSMTIFLCKLQKSRLLFVYTQEIEGRNCKTQTYVGKFDLLYVASTIMQHNQPNATIQ